MRDSERWLIGLQLAILAALCVIMVAIGELLTRARPRVFYVHAGGGGPQPSEDSEPIPIRRPPDKPAA